MNRQSNRNLRLALAAIGCVVGLAAALGLVRFIESMLFETQSTDLTVLATVPALTDFTVMTRPATMRSNTASSSCVTVGNAIHWSACSPWPGMSARRTPAIGPENGRPEI